MTPGKTSSTQYGIEGANSGDTGLESRKANAISEATPQAAIIHWSAGYAEIRWRRRQSQSPTTLAAAKQARTTTAAAASLGKTKRPRSSSQSVPGTPRLGSWILRSLMSAATSYYSACARGGGSVIFVGVYTHQGSAERRASLSPNRGNPGRPKASQSVLPWPPEPSIRGSSRTATEREVSKSNPTHQSRTPYFSRRSDRIVV